SSRARAARPASGAQPNHIDILRQRGDSPRLFQGRTMQLRDALFSSESVTEGHPDKICDQVSDAVLDDCLRQDKSSRVALETAVKTGLVVLFGEITTRANLRYAEIVARPWSASAST